MLHDRKAKLFPKRKRSKRRPLFLQTKWRFYQALFPTVADPVVMRAWVRGYVNVIQHSHSSCLQERRRSGTVVASNPGPYHFRICSTVMGRRFGANKGLGSRPGTVDEFLMFWLPGVMHTKQWCNACIGQPSWAPKRHYFLCIVSGIWSMRNLSIACWILHWEDGQEKWLEDSNETETLRNVTDTSAARPKEVTTWNLDRHTT